MASNSADVLQQMIKDEVQAAFSSMAQQLASALMAAAGGSAPKAAGRRGPRAVKAVRVAEGAGCAVIGCPNPSRSKGYCSAHYQKLHGMAKKPPSLQALMKKDGWKPDAKPQTVTDTKLPRGRAAADLKKAAKKAA